MEYLIIGVVAIAFILLLYIAIPYLQKKNILNAESLMVVQNIINEVQSLIRIARFDNADLKDKAVMLFNVAQIATRSVEQSLKMEDNELKRKVAISGIEQTLKIIGLPLKENDKNLLEIAIKEGVKLLPPTKRKIQ